MKKSLMLGAMCAMVALLTGCQGLLITHNGFPTANPGFLVSDMKGGAMLQERNVHRKFKIVGTAKAEAFTVSYASLVSIGDASYQTLKKQALESYKGAADDIIDVELDFRHDNILGLINRGQ